MTGPRCLCDPVSSRGHEFVEWIGYWLSQCVYTGRDKVGFALGLINIGLWMCIHIPQLWLSHKTRGKGLAFGMLILWCMADLSAVLGLVFTRQKGILALTQFYYLTMDSCLLLQYIWFHHIAPRRAKKNQDIVLTSFGSVNGPSTPVDDFSINDSRNPQAYSNNSTLRSGPALIALSTCIIALAFSPLGDATVSSFLSLQQQTHSDPHYSIFHPSQDSSPDLISLISSKVLSFVAEEVPSCTGSGEIANWKRNIGIGLAWISSIVSSLSKIPQINYQKQRKSTYGLSMIFLALTTITPFTYSGSILIPTRTYDNSNHYRSAKFYLETFPYILVAVFMILSNVIIWYQVWSFRHQTEADRVKDLQERLQAESTTDYIPLEDDHAYSELN